MLLFDTRSEIKIIPAFMKAMPMELIHFTDVGLIELRGTLLISSANLYTENFAEHRRAKSNSQIKVQEAEFFGDEVRNESGHQTCRFNSILCNKLCVEGANNMTTMIIATRFCNASKN